MIEMDAIQAVANRIAEQFDPEEIILFGSYAYGQPTEDSDVDLLVILPFEGRSFYKSLEILKQVDPPFSIDLLARQPDDTERRYAEGDPLIREALDKGKRLYERHRSRVGVKRFLTRAAVDFRYPGEAADQEEARQAYEIATHLRRELLQLL